MRVCPCGSSRTFPDCCGAILAGGKDAETAEALMRSRYTAYVERDIDYLMRTVVPEQRTPADRRAAKQWAHEASFVRLEILATAGGGPHDEAGVVEFVARYRLGAQEHTHHERSRFVRKDGRWLYVDGTYPTSGS